MPDTVWAVWIISEQNKYQPPPNGADYSVDNRKQPVNWGKLYKFHSFQWLE